MNTHPVFCTCEWCRATPEKIGKEGKMGNVKGFSRLEMQYLIGHLQRWQNESFEDSWRGNILLAAASILEAFLQGLDE